MTGNAYPLDLLRAELNAALANLKTDLLREFASKADLSESDQRLTVFISSYETRHQSLGSRVSRLEEWQNRLIGAFAIVAFVTPIMTAIAVRYLG